VASGVNRFELLPCQLKQIKTIITHIKSRKKFHIYGLEGTGKSVLLDYIYDNWKEIDDSLIPIYCRSSRTLRQIFLHICRFLLYHFKHLESIDKFKRIKKIRYSSDIKKLNIRALRNVIFAYITEDNFCIILDHLEYVTPKINSFLTVLYERLPVISASRQSWEPSDYSFKGRLDYCIYLTPKLRIENLTRKDSIVFMNYLYNNLNIKFLDKSHLFDKIFHISDGNPKVIREIFERAQKTEYSRDGLLNLKLILIDHQINKVGIGGNYV